MGRWFGEQSRLCSHSQAGSGCNGQRPAFGALHLDSAKLPPQLTFSLLKTSVKLMAVQGSQAEEFSPWQGGLNG